ncbi:hypothetical protein F8388_001373 [Cannabis sativa]|uniref:Uncharacterized protein n=1 Tax=Cannabis sativa TaxID=3483 RepID=A0A7J6GMI4_CANSA|nr:hypothetical protein F8388_001373 [Cannabis sativa]
MEDLLHSLSLREPHSDGKKIENIACQSTVRIEQCRENNGICSHEVLRDGATNSDFKMVNDKFTRKVSFKLSWCCKGEQSDQHKHDIVSFEKGNITTAERNRKQISLKWESDPQTVLILTKPNSISVKLMCSEMAMVHELIGIQDNKVDLRAVDKLLKDQQEVVLSSELDSFFKSYMYENFGDIGMNIKRLVDEFQQITS